MILRGRGAIQTVLSCGIVEEADTQMRSTLKMRKIIITSLTLLGFALSASRSVASDRPQTPNGFDPLNYLPPGAKIKNKDKDVISADLIGDGTKETIIFYAVGEDPNDHRANIVVLRPRRGGYETWWEDSVEGSWGFGFPTGVYDLNKTGRPQIVAYRTIGASCPGVLDVFEYFDGGIQQTFAHNGHCQSVEIKDLDGDGVPEIIVRTAIYGVNQDIYRWDERKYVLSNGRYPQYYDAVLEGLLKGFSSEVIAASGRLQLANQIVGIFIIQRRFEEAVTFCRELLETIQNPALTTPDRPQGQAKAAIYRLLGDTYQAGGDAQKAGRYYGRADAFTP